MSSAILNQIAFKRETVWGTPVVPDKILAVRMEGGITTDQDIQLLAALRGHLSKNYHQQVGNRVHEGDFTFDFLPDMVGYPLLISLGGLSSALKGGETIVYEHTFTELEVKPSLTIEQKVGENIRRYAGVISSNFKLSGKAGEPLSVSMSLKAKSQASATAISAVPSTVRPIDFSGARIKIGGVTYCEVENFELEYKNNLEYLHTLCDHDPAFSYVAGSEVSGKLELYLNSSTLAEYTDYLANTENSLEVEITGDAIGVASNYKMVITIPRAVFISGATELTEDYNLLAIEFQGLYDDVTSKMIEVVLTNLLPDYTT